MNSLRTLCALALTGLLAATAARAQEPAKPGPEHEHLKTYVGTWNVTMKMGGMETKGLATYKSTLGGLWIASDFEGEVLGTKFQGHGMDTYDAAKKKYVAIWCDSMSTSPMMMEGTLDKATKTLTMTGEGMGPDGKPAKQKTVTTWKDDDHFEFGMYMADEKEPMFTISYKRKK